MNIRIGGVAALLLAVCAGCLQGSAQSAQQPFDVVITHGHIVDGTGSPWYSGDIGIRDGRIAAIGNLAGAAAKRTIDAAGKVVAPGFIDMLGQSELTVLVDPRLPSKIYQGITTEITGEGDSVAPVNEAFAGWTAATLPSDWSAYRVRWELGHALGFALVLCAFAALLRTALIDRPIEVQPVESRSSIATRNSRPA